MVQLFKKYNNWKKMFMDMSMKIHSIINKIHIINIKNEFICDLIIIFIEFLIFKKNYILINNFYLIKNKFIIIYFLNF